MNSISNVEENVLLDMGLWQMFTNQVYFIIVVNRFYIFLTRIKELIDFPTTFVALCDFLELNFRHRTFWKAPHIS